MSSYDRPSPRAAIKDWLSRIATSPEPSQLASKYDQATEHACSKQSPSNRKRKKSMKDTEMHGQNIPHIAIGQGATAIHQSMRAKEDAEHSQKSAPKPKTTAQSLGLYSPFRSFDGRKNDIDSLNSTRSLVRKRRRRSSSTIFDLEPAEYVGPRVVRDIDHADFENITVKSRALRPSNSPSHPCRNSSSVSSEKFGLLRKDTKDYERKPRRKTREDRYELKRSKSKKKTREDQKENAARKKAIRNRKLKTGTTLMHEFVAQNVMHDRLTLRSASSLGLFGKGRASSPVKIRGLSDLAFSEAAFMNSRKERVQNRLPFADRGSQRKRDKVADIDDEISRYFALQKPSNTYEDLLSYKNPIESRHRRSQDERSLGKDHSRKDNSSLSLAGLPEKPFLGFGSSGIASSLTASQIIRSPDKMKHFSSKKASSTRSATPYSWSISGAASLYSLRRRTRPDVTSEVSNRPPPPVLPLSAEMLNQLNRRDGGFSVDHVTTKKTLCEGHSIPRCQDIVPDKKCSEKLVRATRSPSPYKRKEQPNKHTLQYTETNSTAETENQRQENRTVLTATNENKPSIDSGLTSVSCYDKPTIQDSLESFEAELENFLRKCRMHEPQPSPQSISNRKPNSKIQHNERVTASSECLGSEKLVSSRRLVSADHDRYTLNVSQSPSTIPMRHPVTSKHHIRAVRCDHVSQSPGPFVSRSKNLGENHVFSTGLRLDNATKEIYSLGSFADAAPYAWNRHDNIYGQQAVSVDQNLSDVQNLIGLYNPSNTKGLRGFPENESFPFDVDDPDLEDDIIIGCQGRQGSHPGLNRDSSSHLENIQELNPHDMSEWSFNQPIADESSLFFHQIEPEYAQDDNLMTRRNNMLERDLYPAKFSFEEPCIERSQTQSEMIEGFQYRTSDPGSFRLNAMECNYRAHTNSNDEVTIPGFWQPNKLY